MNDEKFMARAIELAQEGRGFTSPNPVVGAVVVKDDKVISEAYHEKFGELHAEALALKKAGPAARDATLYVTLEPCSHQGKTPPCTEAIIQAGIQKVFIGTRDPNPLVNGKGVTQLLEAGLDVFTGLLETECLELNRGFFKHIRSKRPWVTLKLALSTDGYIADSQGKSQWITGQEAREFVHQQRKQYDAIMVGVGTAMKDDPSLLPKDTSGYIPNRIIIDEALTIPYRLKVVNDDYRNKTIVVASSHEKEKKREELQKRKLKVVQTEADDFGWVNLDKALEQLAKEGITSIYCEGGGQLAGSLVQAGLVDELQIFIAPKILGEGIFGFSGFMKTLDKAIQLEWDEPRKLGPDILLIGRLK
ncbi:MAG: bifunctional diaminohydroxyphosphoribosylaminopyrimidine deaminase/5-amino-6-(5-phosphoribosylamino)uracil reductase RibD [Candidatus Marinimicrobia bacterium]|nr:bifunctional diaminohydroxyphosphoribosylaminopyrimidine deaminase/5-amino-6-(5-phosphoribosylamino)uracil reductase RibD [Candidatus Neomarinimicrobiota bacterium]